MSKIAITPLSYHWRAMASPVSGLFKWSPCRISIFRPPTVPPKSSTAIVVAPTVPAPE